MAQSKRTFHRYVIQYEVLSEEPIDIESMSLEQISYSTQDGNCSGLMLKTSHNTLKAAEAASALENQGSDPSFFSLTDKGEDAD